MRRTFTRLFSSSNEKKQVIINALGNDRIGIVSDMTREVLHNGGRVRESQALKLGSHFSITMLVTVPQHNADLLRSSLTNIEGLTTHLTEAPIETHTPPPSAIGYSGRFTLRGCDNTGIVHKVTTLLNKYGLSIETMGSLDEQKQTTCPTLFHFDGIVTSLHPLGNGSRDAMRKELLILADTFNCDIDLEDNVQKYDRYLTAGSTWESVAA